MNFYYIIFHDSSGMSFQFITHYYTSLLISFSHKNSIWVIFNILFNLSKYLISFALHLIYAFLRSKLGHCINVLLPFPSSKPIIQISYPSSVLLRSSSLLLLLLFFFILLFPCFFIYKFIDVIPLFLRHMLHRSNHVFPHFHLNIISILIQINDLQQNICNRCLVTPI